MKKVSVSIFNSDNIEDDLLNLSATSTDYIHIDVGDGKFIERKFNPIRELSKLSSVITKRLDVHFMVDSPREYIEQYCELNCEYITFHCEVKKDILKLLELIKSYGIKCGLAISPDTDLSYLEPFLDDIDLILVMSVVPGKGGQSFMYSTVERVKKIRQMIGNRKIVINVDGGINDGTAPLVESDMVVSGVFVMKSEDMDKSINMLR